MGFGEAVRTVLTLKYATFSGRASRSEFWWFQLFYWLVLVAVALVAGLVTAVFSDRHAGPSPLIIAIAAVAGLFALAMFLPQLALQVRRFHDRNISGWWYLGVLVLNSVPYIGFVSGIALIVIPLFRGTEGPNKFGPDPLRPEATAEVFA
ncbi:DUF805 domain-containing protein [Rhizobium sp. 2YAF20]|uniref:DUF805 domain-containing protein n=1 Tax=Rhizobium sp. 2YAF20 TaxID=3233027 RepID=UPI003F9DF8FA